MSAQLADVAGQPLNENCGKVTKTSDHSSSLSAKVDRNSAIVDADGQDGGKVDGKDMLMEGTVGSDLDEAASPPPLPTIPPDDDIHDMSQEHEMLDLRASHIVSSPARTRRVPGHMPQRRAVPCHVPMSKERADAGDLDGQAPPPGFKSYEKNKKSGGVMGMIKSIINDAKNMEKEAIRSEEQAQKAYEEFVKDTNGSIEEKSKDIVNKSELKAQAEDDRTVAEEEKANVMLELEQLSNENGDLHKACDFVLKNFEIRQGARDQEVEALKQAKAILSGAKFIQVLESN